MQGKRMKWIWLSIVLGICFNFLGCEKPENGQAQPIIKEKNQKS